MGIETQVCYKAVCDKCGYQFDEGAECVYHTPSRKELIEWLTADYDNEWLIIRDEGGNVVFIYCPECRCEFECSECGEQNVPLNDERMCEKCAKEFEAGN